MDGNTNLIVVTSGGIWDEEFQSGQVMREPIGVLKMFYILIWVVIVWI